MSTPGFRGARPLTDEDWAMLRQHRQDVDRAINAEVAARDERIKAEIRRLGHDPDSGEPVPDWIANGIAARAAMGEFDGPLVIHITEENTP